MAKQQLRTRVKSLFDEASVGSQKPKPKRLSSSKPANKAEQELLNNLYKMIRELSLLELTVADRCVTLCDRPDFFIRRSMRSPKPNIRVMLGPVKKMSAILGIGSKSGEDADLDFRYLDAKRKDIGYAIQITVQVTGLPDAPAYEIEIQSIDRLIDEESPYYSHWSLDPSWKTYSDIDRPQWPEDIECENDPQAADIATDVAYGNADPMDLRDYCMLGPSPAEDYEFLMLAVESWQDREEWFYEDLSNYRIARLAVSIGQEISELEVFSKQPQEDFRVRRKTVSVRRVDTAFKKLSECLVQYLGSPLGFAYDYLSEFDDPRDEEREEILEAAGRIKGKFLEMRRFADNYVSPQQEPEWWSGHDIRTWSGGSAK